MVSSLVAAALLRPFDCSFQTRQKKYQAIMTAAWSATARSSGGSGRLHQHFTEPQIVEAVFVITIYIAVSKFGDALGVELEPVFSEIESILHVKH